MTIQVYPEVPSTVGDGGVTVSGAYGSDATTDNYNTYEGKNLPAGFYTYQSTITGGATGALGIGENYTSSITSQAGLVVATTPGKFKIRVQSFWEAQNGPLTSTGSLQSVDYHNEYLFLTGSRGFSAAATTSAVFITTNNSAWTEVNLAAASVAYNVLYDGSFYIVGHRSDGIMVSTDLVNWTTRTFVAGAAAGMGRYESGSSFFKYVFGGQNGNMIVSTNGTTWTTRNSGHSDMPYNVRYLNGLWFAVSSSSRISVSTNGGNNWNVLSTANFISNDTITDVAYGNGRYVAVSLFGRINVSTDGFNWTSSENPGNNSFVGGNQYLSASYADPYFFVGGGGSNGPIISTNGTNWTGITSSVTAGASAAVMVALSIPTTSVNFPNSKYYYAFCIGDGSNQGPSNNTRIDGYVSLNANRRRWSKTISGRNRSSAQGYVNKIADYGTITITTV